MKHLIEKLEQASEGTQHVVLYDALEYAHEQGWLTATQQDFALHLLHGGAFIEAAMMLVPKGCAWNIGTMPRSDTKHCWGEIREIKAGGFADYPKPRGRACWAWTPALALCIAAMKAREV